MKRFFRHLSILLTAILLGSLVAIPVLADSAVSTVNIYVGVNLAAGDRLGNDFDLNQSSSEGTYIYSSSSKVSVADAEWKTSLNKDITIGETPKLEVTLSAESGYYFKGTYRSSNVTIKGGTFVSASRKNDDTLVVTLKVNPIKGQYQAPDEVNWRSSGLGKARWDSVDGADAYDVYLYRGGSLVHKLEAYKGTSYDFYPYMTKYGTYSFKVRAVPSTDSEQKYGKKSDWTESDEMYIAKEDVSDGSGQTNGQPGGNTGTGVTQVGWIKDGNTWYYRYPDGGYQKNSWLLLNNKYYLFDSEGRMLTGWQQRNNNRWFYLNQNGDMFTGWLRLGDKLYYLYETAGDDQGVMCYGWIQHSGQWYFAGSDGAMVKGWQEIDGKWRYFNPDTGVMAVNTTINGFYVDGNGIWNR